MHSVLVCKSAAPMDAVDNSACTLRRRQVETEVQQTKFVLFAACIHAKISAETVYGTSAESVQCAPDGSYERVQCVGSTCWCVDTRNGAELPGTRTIFQRPNCDSNFRYAF